MVDYLINDEYNHVPLKSNKLSVFGKTVKSSFQGTVILNVFRNRIDIEKEHSIKWIDLLIKNKYIVVESGPENQWNAKGIYTWSSTAKIPLKDKSEKDELSDIGKKKQQKTNNNKNQFSDLFYNSISLLGFVLSIYYSLS